MAHPPSATESHTERLGLALEGGLMRVDAEFVSPASDFSPVRGTGSWENGPTLALTAHLSTNYEVTPHIRSLMRVSCRYEHMIPEDGTLLRAYDAALCGVHTGLTMDLGGGWRSDLTGTLTSPRTGRVRLAGRSVDLGDDIRTDARAEVALEW
ncbi:MAG: hypothetical protein V6Z81_10385 [Parvularculales bacterium]